MTEREPPTGNDPLRPDLTLAQLVAALPSWVRPDPERESWVEVLRERLPPALAARLLLPLVQVGSLQPNGRASLPYAEWEWLGERFLVQARAVLERRDALLQAERGPPLDELAWVPHVEDWQAMDLGVVTPYLQGRIVGPRPGEPDALHPTPLLALGPGQAWARLLGGWVSLGRREEAPPPAEPRRAFPPRSLDPGETDARLADLRHRIEAQLADLVPPPEGTLSLRFIVGPLDALPRAVESGEDRADKGGGAPADPEPGGTGEALTAAERLIVQVYRIFGNEMPFWLLRRNVWLGQERPIDLLEDRGNYERLADHLTAVEVGVYM